MMIPKKKKDKDGDKKAVKQKRDRKNPETMMPLPRPTETSEEIRKELKQISEEIQKKQLASAKKIQEQTVPGELGPGWNHPKEAEILQMWSEWNKLFDSQTDLVASIKEHFEKATERYKAQREAEKKELES